MTATARAKPQRRKSQRWQDAEEMRWAIRHWAVCIGVKSPAVYFRAMQTKWASISSGGRMTMDTSLLAVPKDLGEFVIVHELVHLLAPNHGRVFKAFMDAYMPDWQERAARLQACARPAVRA